MIRILGITWNGSALVSFDPATGAVTEKHASLNPNENFVGLTYDCNRNRIYALSQTSCNLYSVDPLMRKVGLIGKLNIAPGLDASSLAYDPISDIVYTVVLHSGFSGLPQSDLAKVNVTNASVTTVGTITNGICNSLCWRESDGMLNGLVVLGTASSDKASVVTITPATAAMTAVFETPYHTIAGLARRPGRNAYISYVSGSTDFYGEINLDSKTVTQLGTSNAGVGSAAMVYRNFFVAPAPHHPHP